MKKNIKHFLRLTDFSLDEINKIYEIADEIPTGKYDGALKGKTAVMFFPESSIRTRVTFEKGIFQLGGQTVLFPPEALDKKEDLRDVTGYLNNWADFLIIRHKDIGILEKIAGYSAVPVINALTAVNHPCEMLSDFYALSKIIKNVTAKKFLFLGTKGNIGLAWKEASERFGFSLEQCCPQGYEIEGLKVHHNLNEAVHGKDIICTDSLPKDELQNFRDFKITREIMELANEGAVLNPCPPFYRGEEVSADAIDSKYFVGYGFKKSLQNVQQALLLYCGGCV